MNIRINVDSWRWMYDKYRLLEMNKKCCQWERNKTAPENKP